MLEFFVAFVTLFVTVLYLLLMYEYGMDSIDEPKPPKVLPFVSIVIPVYNEQGVVGTTLDAVIAMDYPKDKLEVIVVDDESKDATAKEVEEYTHKYKFIKLIRNKHTGIGNSSAKNTGIKHARGELIATLDSDSYPSRDALKKMTAYFQDPSVMAATSEVRAYKPRNIIEQLQAVEYAVTIVSRKLLSFLDAVTVTPGPLSVYRASVFKNLGDFDTGSILEDQEIAYRMQANNYKIESSISATVYTQVPSKIIALLRQRIRWNRGGIRNYIKYRRMFSLKYGDFGIAILPLGFLGAMMVFVVLLSFFYTIITGQYFESYTYGLNSFFYGFGAVHVVSFLILLLTVAWIIIARKVIQNEKQDLSYIKIAAYLIAYPALITIFWIATFYEEIAGKKQKW